MSQKQLVTINCNINLRNLLGMMKQNLLDTLGHISQPVDKINPDFVIPLLQETLQQNEALRHMIMLHAQAEANALQPTEKH